MAALRSQHLVCVGTQGQQQLTHSSGSGCFQALLHNRLSIFCRPPLGLQDCSLLQDWKSSTIACLSSPPGDLAAGAGHSSAGCILPPAGNNGRHCRVHSQLPVSAGMAGMPETTGRAAAVARLSSTTGPGSCLRDSNQPAACRAGQVSS